MCYIIIDLVLQCILCLLSVTSDSLPCHFTMTENKPIRTKKSNRTTRSGKSQSKDKDDFITKTSRQKGKKATRYKRSQTSSDEESVQTSSSSSDDELETAIIMVNGHINCPHCDGKLKVEVPQKEMILYTRHKTEEERREENNESKRRWAERNRDKVRELNKLANRRYRERNKELKQQEEDLEEKEKKMIEIWSKKEYVYHNNPEEKRSAKLASNKRWAERNKDYLREKTRKRIRRMRLQRKLDKEEHK